jgi:hypothetical protein
MSVAKHKEVHPAIGLMPSGTGSLPAALEAIGVEVAVLLPRHWAAALWGTAHLRSPSGLDGWNPLTMDCFQKAQWLVSGSILMANPGCTLVPTLEFLDNSTGKTVVVVGSKVTWPRPQAPQTAPE